MEFILKYFLFVYENYIQEDWSTFTKIGRILLKPAWFVRSILFWIYSVMCFPLVLLHMKLVEIDITRIIFETIAEIDMVMSDIKK